ncbi:alpha-ketoglutaric semialdehyde dehydrogenase GucD [Salibacterium halotolerans]|uniref:Aldehyde dehydrogenase (NAD+) n=1 Tax=Salibacterium halotolerans TaxID=1884432 RepID=A0A1I5LFE5_9BACI|nr:alpha-ketoglutaric semialdehyde dehydrogenase GucD [Salibacterium halotolerans]SFO95937.1 aldehyde dehydrogenase (NAD+) [Salibacterium halotolerans]
MTITVEQTYNNHINGVWKTDSEEKKPSINPAHPREVVGYYTMSESATLHEAVEAAAAAKREWRKMAEPARGDILYKAAAVLEARVEEIAETMTKEMGKTLPEAKGETMRGVQILRYYAGEGMRQNGDVIPSTDKDALMFTNRTPLGVVGVITPWNFPVAIPVWKIAPALVYGNTVVFKPAQEAAVTAAKVVECLAEAGLPEGVLNFVTGSGSVIGRGLAEHPDVNGITFTGSEQVGRGIGQAALARGAKYQLEMGGKNPVIVTEDADLDAAVDAVISGGLKSTGQKCTATSRVIVQSGVYEGFKEKLLTKVKDIKVGDGMNKDSWMGPCASEKQFRSVTSYIETGKQEGAALLCGGETMPEEGYYVTPAVFDNVDPDMTIAREEIFGPVLALMKVETLEEAIETANDTEYGLSASIFTNNIQESLSFMDDIEAGLVRINAESAGVELQAPFGGMKNSSSHSREQGEAAKEFFTSIKTVLVK